MFIQSDLFMQSLLAIRTNVGLLHIMSNNTRRPFRVREKIQMVPDFAPGVKVLRHEHNVSDPEAMTTF